MASLEDLLLDSEDESSDDDDNSPTIVTTVVPPTTASPPKVALPSVGINTPVGSTTINRGPPPSMSHTNTSVHGGPIQASSNPPSSASSSTTTATSAMKYRGGGMTSSMPGPSKASIPSAPAATSGPSMAQQKESESEKLKQLYSKSKATSSHYNNPTSSQHQHQPSPQMNVHRPSNSMPQRSHGVFASQPPSGNNTSSSRGIPPSSSSRNPSSIMPVPVPVQHNVHPSHPHPPHHPHRRGNIGSGGPLSSPITKPSSSSQYTQQSSRHPSQHTTHPSTQHRNIQAPSSSSTHPSAPSPATQHYNHVRAQNVPSQRSSQPQQQPQQQQRPTSSSAPSSAHMTHPSQDEQKKRKEQFLMFTKVLMKYLEAKDTAIHGQAKQVIRDCAQKNKDGEPGYSSLSAAMQARLKHAVGLKYWQKAEEYLGQYLFNSYKQKNKGVNQQEFKKKAFDIARSAAADLPGSEHASRTIMGIRSTNMSSNVGGISMSNTAYGTGANQGVTQLQHHQQQSTSSLTSHQNRNHISSSHPGTVGAGQSPISATPTTKTLPPKETSGYKGTAPGNSTVSTTMPTKTKTKTTVPTTKKTTSKKEKSTTGKKRRPKPKVPPINTGATVGAMTPVGAQTPSSIASTTVSGKKKTPKVSSTSSSGSGNKKNSLGAATPNAQPSAKVSQSNGGSSKAVTPSSSSKKTQIVVEPPKEWEEFMELVDHAVEYDANLCALLVNKKKSSSAASNAVNVSEEQNILLYGAGSNSISGSKISSDSSKIPPPESSNIKSEEELSSHLNGWGERNIISARMAWAKLRLVEQENMELEMNSMKLPTYNSNMNNMMTDPTFNKKESTILPECVAWFNEEKAEQDETLALISEATQHYIKSLLEGSISSARQRLNLDGIRLWHQQHAAVAAKESSIYSKSVPPQLINDPPLSLRIGCDVRRQIALAEGNAAKTCQRMEEALARHDKSGNLADDDTLLQAASMSQLSQLPKLQNAANKADYDGRCSYEIYGGKHSSEPPLGRVPKRAKLLVQDLNVSLERPNSAVRRRRVRTRRRSFF
mmetsp:Transcript_18949/g.21518  ORF Transcript_18949/g.21518 Transcript_18949/m.21518 type:complete len:1046 (-) Transcript_18949:114-3251(-)